MAGSAHALAALFVVAAWWLSTGAVLVVVFLRRPSSSVRLAGASALAIAGLAGLAWSSRHASQAAAYVAFCSALAVWAWHELTFLLGVVTGPRKEPCPPDALGWRRFAFATAVVIHHELALALTAGLIVTTSWGQPNQVGTWTFGVLWVMRLSAKLNLFLGVRSLTEDFVPQRLRYLLSYFRKGHLSPLMPVSLVAATAVVLWLGAGALAIDASDFELTGNTLVATILALAVVEHVWMVVPAPDARLWWWAIRSVRDQG